MTPREVASLSLAKRSLTKRLGCAVVLVACGAIAALTVLALIPPAARPMLPNDAIARGEALEQALVAAVTKVRDPAGEAWAIAMDPADINAWLATRLPKWIAHDPSLAPFERATTVRISAADGALIVDAPVGPEALGLVGTLRLPIALDDSPDAKLMVDIGAARIGLLPVPISDAGWDAAGTLAEELSRFETRYPDRRISLADGRLVEVRAISCEDGRIKIRFATLPASAPLR
ncbi:MAG: hypothetical protein QM516_12480 [Limnohabitans sp.]|nr:hypothetical protein [Limnohabitans sp.]